MLLCERKITCLLVGWKFFTWLLSILKFLPWLLSSAKFFIRSLIIFRFFTWSLIILKFFSWWICRKNIDNKLVKAHVGILNNQRVATHTMAPPCFLNGGHPIPSLLSLSCSGHPLFSPYIYRTAQAVFSLSCPAPHSFPLLSVRW